MTTSGVDRVEELTGYRPLTVIVQADQVHMFYETLALSRREMQEEIVHMLVAAHQAWPASTAIVISVMRRAKAGGSVCRADSLQFNNEVVTATASRADIEEYGRDNARALWEQCIFTRWIFHGTDRRDLRFLRYPYLPRDGGVQG